MPVVIGQKPDHGFDHPVGLLTDCHRRVERFLGVLVELGGKLEGSQLDESQRQSLSTALRYFREAAPKHTADEEESLFPRLRRSSQPEAAAALAEMERLEADHRHVAPMHAEVDLLASKWLADAALPAAEAARFKHLTLTLAELYREHIRVEEDYVFPIAAKALDTEALMAVGREMAARRNAGHEGP